MSGTDADGRGCWQTLTHIWLTGNYSKCRCPPSHQKARGDINILYSSIWWIYHKQFHIVHNDTQTVCLKIRCNFLCESSNWAHFPSSTLHGRYFFHYTIVLLSVFISHALTFSKLTSLIHCITRILILFRTSILSTK